MGSLWYRHGLGQSRKDLYSVANLGKHSGTKGRGLRAKDFRKKVQGVGPNRFGEMEAQRATVTETKRKEEGTIPQKSRNWMLRKYAGGNPKEERYE